ncbi:myeloid cell nuclear differentiation antigen-like [Loxodonta africana]|uniref:myeloid cell nuclear differentiation antigen-like n=1 Tax=Loxodonta africana TaxID=9785 RepID=UPI0030D15FBF
MALALILSIKKKKNTAKEKPVAKKKKVSQEQSQPPCPSGASSSATVGHSPPPQISSPTPSFTSLTEKTVNKKNTIYEIQDNTGKMDVVGDGKWQNIKSEERDTLQFFCFQLRTIEYKLKLMCGIHSFIKESLYLLEV